MKIVVYKISGFQFSSRYVNGHLFLFTIVRFQHIATLCALWSQGYHKIFYIVGMPSKYYQLYPIELVNSLINPRVIASAFLLD